MGLKSCHLEILSATVDLLDFKDICSLRLSCKYLAKASVNRHFTTFFHSKNIVMAEDALRHFAEGVQAGGLRCLIRELRLTGTTPLKRPGATTVRRRSTSKASKARKVSLLAGALNALAQSSDNGSLSLMLGVEVITSAGERVKPAAANDSWRRYIYPRWNELKHVWQAAADTFEIVVGALGENQLQLTKLDVFNGSDMQLCSLGSEGLDATDWEHPAVGKAFESLQSLSISLSNRTFKFYEGRGHASRAATESVTQEQDFVGLARVLSLTPALKSLDLHYVTVTGAFERVQYFPHEMALQRLCDLDILPMLTYCRIRGITTRETTLLSFIKRTELHELCLEGVSLSSGTFRPIFDYCTSPASKMTKLYFDCLKEDNHVHTILFDHSILISPETSDSPVGTSRALRRQGADIKETITYSSPPAFPMDSPFLTQWLRRQRIEYGPL